MNWAWGQKLDLRSQTTIIFIVAREQSSSVRKKTMTVSSVNSMARGWDLRVRF
jgi:hypothetical protein